MLDTLRDSGEFFLMIDASDIYAFDKGFYNKLLSWPGDFITIMDFVA